MRILKLSLLSIFGLACLINFASASDPEGPGRSITPTSNFGRLFEPWKWGYGPQEDAEDALSHQGYSFTWHGNSDLTLNPDPSLPEWIEGIGANAGAIFHGGHGTNAFISIEPYEYTIDGLIASSLMAECYASAYPDLAIYWWDEGHAYSVGVGWPGISGRAQVDDGIVDIETCSSDQSPTWPGARVEFVNLADLTDPASDDNSEAIWGGMDGQGSGVHDSWWYRTAGWAYQNATSYCVMRQPQTNGKYTTLAPCVKWASFENNDQITSETELTILFDTKIETVGSALQAFIITPRPGKSATIEIDDAELDNDTTLIVTLKPVDGEFGTSYLSALSDQIVSHNNASAHLDGSGEGGPDDKTWRLKHGNDTAALTTGFQVDENGLASWSVENRYRTQEFQIWGGSGEDWTLVGTSPATIGQHEIQVGTAYPAYQLVELEINDRRLLHETVAPRERVERIPLSHLTADSLRIRLNQLIETRGEPEGGRSGIEGNRLVIFAAPPFVDDAWYHADYREWHDQIDVEVVDIAAEYGSSPTTIESGIRARVASDPSHYFLLVGDGTSVEAWTGPLWNEPTWPEVKNDYLAAGYPPGGDQTHNLIPVGFMPDPEPRDINMGYFEPYWYLGDGPHYCQSDRPDKVVSRLPFTQAWQYLAYIWKLQYYENGMVGEWPYQTLLCVGDVDLYFGDGSGAYAASVANSVVSALPPNTYTECFLQSDYFWAWQRIEAVVNRWNSDLELVYFISSRSTRYNVGHFLSLDQGFDVDLIRPYSWTPWIIGSTCDTGDEFRTMNPEYNETVACRLLEREDRGAIAVIGPGSGSWQEGHLVIAPLVTEKVFEDIYRPPMESFRLAQCEMLESLDPIDDYDVYDTIRSYQFYGDPCLLLHHIGYSVDVPEQPKGYCLELKQNRPNPIQRSTSIQFGLTQSGPIKLKIYDASGRLVRTLIDGQFGPGNYQIDWRRNTDSGDSAASGVYFCRMSAEGQEFSRKLIVL